jgi:REP element-mobilizing transposase RayT
MLGTEPACCAMLAVRGSCVMPNHVHAVLRPNSPHTLKQTLQSWKSFTSKVIGGVLQRRGPLWQPEYYDHIVRDLNDLDRTLRYVLTNPVSAGLNDWPWFGVGMRVGSA